MLDLGKIYVGERAAIAMQLLVHDCQKRTAVCTLLFVMCAAPHLLHAATRALVAGPACSFVIEQSTSSLELNVPHRDLFPHLGHVLCHSRNISNETELARELSRRVPGLGVPAGWTVSDCGSDSAVGPALGCEATDHTAPDHRAAIRKTLSLSCCA